MPEKCIISTPLKQTKNLKLKTKKVKACVHYFLSIFKFFTPNESPLKTTKIVFNFI